MDLSSVQADVAAMDLRLREIANRPVDMSDPDWHAKLATQAPPAEEAGVAAEAAAALATLLDAYESGDSYTRAEVRRIFRAHPSFNWGVGLPRTWSTPAEFRRRLVHLSARDQARDARDELMTLWELCAAGRERGIAIEPILREVAAISGDTDHYGMGSMRHLIMRGLERR